MEPRQVITKIHTHLNILPFPFHNLISDLDLLRNMTALDKDNFGFTIRLFHGIYHSKNPSVLHIFRAHQFESYGCQTQHPYTQLSSYIDVINMRVLVTVASILAIKT